MSRQIKFRGKRVDNCEWIVGDLLHIAGGCLIYFDSDTDTTEPDIEKINPVAIEFFKDEIAVVDPDTVGQFTGMLDKNGKEIYEGDLVRYYDYIEDELVTRPVEYLADYCAFCAVHPKRDPDGIFAQWEYEVVGNIHDKKESDGED